MKKLKDIAAGIVLYNPSDETRFKAAFNSVINQFSMVYIFDNSTRKVVLPMKSERVIYKTEHQNKGIAYALNRIMELASQDGYEWVVTMDQDSIIPISLVNEYFKRINIKNVGIICPQVIDKRRKYEIPKQISADQYIQECITSGSCTSVKAWKKVGGFDEQLFIDLVDNDFCKRIVLSGYKIIQMHNMVLNQEFGNITPKDDKIQNFWLKVSKILHNKNFAKLGYKKVVYPIRVYYTNRNILYLNKKYKKYNGIGYSNYNTSNYLGFWIAFNLPSILRAKNKRKVVQAIYSGVRDGVKMKVKEWKTKL